KGADVTFIVRRHDPVCAIAFGSEAFSVLWLPAPESGRGVPSDFPDPVPHARWAGVGWREDAADTVAAIRAFRPDWLIVDHYAFDARWHDEMRSSLDCQIMAIDDLADRALSVDLLLDANFAEGHAQKYAGRLMRTCRHLGGPRYALLAPAYKAAPRYEFSRDVKSLGVFIGGTDPGGASARVLQACRDEGGFSGVIEVVSTSANPHLESLQAACAADSGVQLSLDLSDLSAFYARHDLQVGAGGTATYERCCIGAPTIALIVAANQLAVVPGLADKGVLRAARLGDDPDADVAGVAPPLGDVVRQLVAEPDARRHRS
ncbi:MAG: UDP-2,4-diacetamido-2,4,6-trideoxy-beta-L-altropyranose hydrolase, partial [Burkholderiales bacterium]